MHIAHCQITYFKSRPGFSTEEKKWKHRRPYLNCFSILHNRKISFDFYGQHLSLGHSYLLKKFHYYNYLSQQSFFFFFFLKDFLIYLFIYLFIFGCVGSSVRARAFSSCGKRGPLSIAVRGPPFIAVRGPFSIAAPPAAGHRLQTRRLSNCGSRAQPLRGMWDLPRPGLEPVSPAPAGRLSTTAPPGKPPAEFLFSVYRWLCSSQDCPLDF